MSQFVPGARCRHCSNSATQIVSASFAGVSNVPMCEPCADKFSDSLIRTVQKWADKNGFAERLATKAGTSHKG